MCNQAVGLAAAVLEKEGIATVAIQLLRMVAQKVQPPRALFVPFAHGFPLDTPDNPERQHAVIDTALSLLENSALKPPVLIAFHPGN